MNLVSSHNLQMCSKGISKSISRILLLVLLYPYTTLTVMIESVPLFNYYSLFFHDFHIIGTYDIVSAPFLSHMSLIIN